MSTALVTVGPNPWMVPWHAAKRLGVSEMKVYKFALLGHIRVLVEPGENVRFNREDVEKLAAEIGAVSVTAS